MWILAGLLWVMLIGTIQVYLVHSRCVRLEQRYNEIAEELHSQRYELDMEIGTIRSIALEKYATAIESSNPKLGRNETDYSLGPHDHSDRT